MKRAGLERDARAELVKEAWIGDAVLSLHARLKILREDGVLDGPKSVRMTSNQFLGTMGEPTKVGSRDRQGLCAGGSGSGVSAD